MSHTEPGSSFEFKLPIGSYFLQNNFIIILGHKLTASDRVEYSGGHLRAVASDEDRKKAGFQNNTLRKKGACFGIITGKGSVPGGK